jgi:hypothetical protein
MGALRRNIGRWRRVLKFNKNIKQNREVKNMNTIKHLMAATALSLSGVFAFGVGATEIKTESDIAAAKKADPQHQRLAAQDTDALIGQLKGPEGNAVIYVLGERALHDATDRAKIVDQLIVMSTMPPRDGMAWQAAAALELIAEVANMETAFKIGSHFRLLLQTNGDYDVRAKAAAGLGTIAEQYPEAVPEVAGILIRSLVGEHRDHDGDVRHKAIRALAIVALKYPEENLLRASFETLKNGLREDDDSHVRWQSAISLGWLAPRHLQFADDAMNLLRAAIEHDEDQDVATEAIASMVKIAKASQRFAPATHRYLKEIANDTKRSEQVREAALELIQDVPVPEGVANLSPGVK